MKYHSRPWVEYSGHGTMYFMTVSMHNQIKQLVQISYDNNMIRMKRVTHDVKFHQDGVVRVGLIGVGGAL